jgi:2-dehydro-3-deoxygluconokinase
MPDVVTLGEAMVCLNPLTDGPLRYVPLFWKSVAGAEANFAVGLVRLGQSAGWISRVGDDEFGRYVVSFLRGEGVDTSQVRTDLAAPTGVYFKERHGLQDPRVYYYRSASAASRLGPGDLDEDYLAAARYLHLTGITPALSESCREAVRAAQSLARARGVTVTFDPNLRLKLWSVEEARKTIGEFLEGTDVFLPGLDEGRKLFDVETADEVADAALARGPRVVVVKLGRDGAYLAIPGERIHVPGFPVAQVVDSIGAGDAFAAGFVAALLKGCSLREAVRVGNAAGAFAVTVPGDVEGLPTWAEVQSLLGGTEAITR